MNKKVLIEVISGPEGPCLSVGNDSGGYRIAGPKPWGGGRMIHQFSVNLDELIAQANAHAFEEGQNDV